MFNNGLDIGGVFRHPVFLATFIIAFPAWIIAFAGQCAVEAVKTGGGAPAAGTLWFAIWVQLFVTVFLFLTVASDSLATYRFQFAFWIAVTLPFAIGGVNGFIYDKGFGRGLTTGAGWLLCSMVDIVWLLFLTSESDSFLFNLFNSAGNGGLSLWGEGRPGGRSRKNNDSDYHTEASSLRHGAADRGMSSHDMSSHNGYSMGMGYGSPSLDHPPRSMQSAVPPAVQQMAPTPTQAAPPAAREEYGSAPSPVATSPQQPIKKAKANYAYMASPDDPNEVSFAKGEILEVLDDAGKWFQVKTSGGIQGIAPSNYLTLL